jgi:hypothetical protein
MSSSSPDFSFLQTEPEKPIYANAQTVTRHKELQSQSSSDPRQAINSLFVGSL